MMSRRHREKILKVGIASRSEMKERTLAIARGQYVPERGDPKVWFTSLESLAQVLSKNNLLLLEIIKRMRPASIKDLAEATGRERSNLSRTLHTMERYGLLRLEKTERGRISPEVMYDQVSFDVRIDQHAH